MRKKKLNRSWPGGPRRVTDRNGIIERFSRVATMRFDSQKSTQCMQVVPYSVFLWTWIPESKSVFFLSNFDSFFLMYNNLKRLQRVDSIGKKELRRLLDNLLILFYQKDVLYL